MFGIGGTELLVIFLIALLVLGPEKLPEVAKYIAKIMREVRRAGDEVRSHIDPDGDLYRTTPDLSKIPKATPTPEPIKRLPDDIELEKRLAEDKAAEDKAKEKAPE